MEKTLPFADLLEAVDQLPAADQEILIEIVRRRVAERSRERLAAEIEESQQEFERGECRASTVDELMNEIRNPRQLGGRRISGSNYGRLQYRTRGC